MQFLEAYRKEKPTALNSRLKHYICRLQEDRIMSFPNPMCTTASLGPAGAVGPGVSAVRPFRFSAPFLGPLLPPLPTPGGGDGICGCESKSGVRLMGGCGDCSDGGGGTGPTTR